MTPKYFDIHAHAHFPAFKEDRDEVIKRALDNDTWLINIGTQKETSKEAVDLAHKYPKGVYAAVGLHPIHTEKCHDDDMESEIEVCETEFDYDFYKKLAQDEKVVAIGECGLDFFHLEENTKAKQIEIFKKHIELSLEVKKPLMIHIRNAYDDALKILNSYFLIHSSNLKGNIHFFAGNIEVAKEFLALGFSLSFTGVITYPKSKKIGMADYEAIIKETPIDKLMSETDAPYVAPAPYRGKRNEPSYVKEVVAKIAEIKGLTIREASEKLVYNARKTFNIND